MAYSADSFVADEQPTTAKWNKLWSNDAAFNDGSGFANGALGSVHASLASGMVVQAAYSGTTAYSSGTTTIPLDDTIPQVSEGNAVTSLSFTPKAATNILVIIGQVMASSSIANQNMMLALFTSASTNAVGMGNTRTATTADTTHSVLAMASIVAGTTSALTISSRAGGNGPGTTSINGSAGARLFGAMNKSWIQVLEYKV